MSQKSNSPIFIMGCSRGGTTLIHSILSQHDKLAAFPESNILYHCFGDLNLRRYGLVTGRRKLPKYALQRLRNIAGITSYFPRKEFLKFLESIERSDLSYLIPEKEMRIKRIFKLFSNLMTHISNGKNWVEKSPQNIFCINHIEKHIPQAKFIHIVRNGPDNIASLMDAAAKHQTFRERFSGDIAIEKAISYWNNCLLISKKSAKKENHTVIRLEDLINSPNETMKPIESLLNLKFDNTSFSYKPDKIISPKEKWKRRDNTNLEKPEDKFSKLFNSNERSLIIEKALNVEFFFPTIIKQ